MGGRRERAIEQIAVVEIERDEALREMKQLTGYELENWLLSWDLGDIGSSSLEKGLFFKS